MSEYRQTGQLRVAKGENHPSAIYSSLDVPHRSFSTSSAATGPSELCGAEEDGGPTGRTASYVATTLVATGWLRLWFATAIGSMVVAVATQLRLKALAAS